MVTDREFEQLSLRVTELSASAGSNAVLAEQIKQIRTDQERHEAGHAAMRRQLAAALSGLALTIIGLIGQYLHMFLVK